VHSVLGQKRRSACGSLASRLNNQWRCLLWLTWETAVCDPEQMTWHASSGCCDASWQCPHTHCCCNARSYCDI
jgi:hypothetical protein